MCYVLPLCSFGYIQAVGSNDAAICIFFIPVFSQFGLFYSQGEQASLVNEKEKI